MTQRDKWKKRPAVLRYRSWADMARASAPANLPTAPCLVNWRAFIAVPNSWPKKKQAAMIGQLHKGKPDRDNIDKALLDALWKSDDSCVATGTITKLWCMAGQARLEVEASEVEEVVL